MNPYPGLRAFRPDESEVFMGREMVHAAVSTRVRISPLTLMVARSGVGKSSFLTCRLMPGLAKNSVVHYRNEWGGAAPEELVDLELQKLATSGNGFQEKPVLVLDQFEDVFKLPYQRDVLWDKLAELINIPDSPVAILISMREEWLGAWSESAQYLPASFQTLVRLAPLTSHELTRAICRPPEIEGNVTVEEQLVTELLNDLRRPTAFGLGEGYVEPGLLQLVCHRLWNEAFATPTRTMTVELYNKLGRADRISRQLIWDELGSAGENGARFSADDRVLWVGMTRHLVVAQGIKAITDPTALARKIRMQDLGLAGEAVTHKRLPTADRAYLLEMPERRGQPPVNLLSWISDVVEKGVQAGFLKQQHGIPSQVGKPSKTPEFKNLFEISHDALSDMFQQFSVEFETWIRGRWAMLVGALFGGLLVLPVVIDIIYDAATRGLLDALLTLGTVVGILLLYLLVIWIVVLLAEFFLRIIGYPILRRLARGAVPMPLEPRKPPSAFRTRITMIARRLGFLPR